MKFGKIFRQTVDTRMPHWREHCVDYKRLKVAIKRQLAEGTQGAPRLRPLDVPAVPLRRLARPCAAVHASL